MNANQPIPLLYRGQDGDYFGTDSEALPADLHRSIQEVGTMLIREGLTYLGKLTCSQFSQVEVYAYATSDRQIGISVMAGDSGLSGIDCVSNTNFKNYCYSYKGFSGASIAPLLLHELL